MVIIFFLNLASLIFYYGFVSHMQGFPYVNMVPPFILAFCLAWSIHLWRLDPGLATLNPERLPVPLYPQQALKVFCRKCHIIRLQGVVHCPFCQVCIKDYDHHCGVVGKCSGLHTHDAIMIWSGSIAVYWASLALCGFGICYQMLLEYLANRYLAKK